MYRYHINLTSVTKNLPNHSAISELYSNRELALNIAHMFVAEDGALYGELMLHILSIDSPKGSIPILEDKADYLNNKCALSASSIMEHLFGYATCKIDDCPYKNIMLIQKAPLIN